MPRTFAARLPKVKQPFGHPPFASPIRPMATAALRPYHRGDNGRP